MSNRFNLIFLSSLLPSKFHFSHLVYGGAIPIINSKTSLLRFLQKRQKLHARNDEMFVLSQFRVVKRKMIKNNNGSNDGVSSFYLESPIENKTRVKCLKKDCQNISDVLNKR